MIVFLPLSIAEGSPVSQMPTTLEGAVIFIAVSLVAALTAFANKLANDNRVDRHEERQKLEQIANAVTGATNEFKMTATKMLEEHREDRETYQDSMNELQKEITAGFSAIKTEMAGIQNELRESRRFPAKGGGG